MIKASAYIFKSMSAMLDQLAAFERAGDNRSEGFDSELLRIQGTLEKFSLRYQEDEGLQRICDEFDEYLHRRDEELMERISQEIEEIIYLRRLESMVCEMRERGNRSQSVDLT